MIRHVLVAAFLISLLPTRADAIMGAPEPIDTPVPEKWRDPLSRMLRDLDVSNPASTVEASKAARFQFLPDDPEMMIFRVVHEETCTTDRDECLTIIARIEKDELVSHSMFSAGGKINRGDVIQRFLGASSPPIFFYGQHKIVSVRITARGLLVTSGPAIELPK